jgi:hypothetical protein
MVEKMPHKSRVGAKRKRALSQQEPASRLAQILFRLGEFGAVGCVVFAMVKASQRPLALGVPIDVYVLVAMGAASFLLGWSIRWMLTGNSDLS